MCRPVSKPRCIRVTIKGTEISFLIRVGLRSGLIIVAGGKVTGNVTGYGERRLGRRYLLQRRGFFHLMTLHLCLRHVGDN